MIGITVLSDIIFSTLITLLRKFCKWSGQRNVSGSLDDVFDNKIESTNRANHMMAWIMMKCEEHASQHFALTHTHDPWNGFKRSKKKF